MNQRVNLFTLSHPSALCDCSSSFHWMLQTWTRVSRFTISSQSPPPPPMSTFPLEYAHPPLSNPHQPNASAFVITALSALCLHGLGSWGESKCWRQYALEGALLWVWYWPVLIRRWLLDTWFEYRQYTVQFMWRFYFMALIRIQALRMEECYRF